MTRLIVSAWHLPCWQWNELGPALLQPAAAAENAACHGRTTTASPSLSRTMTVDSSHSSSVLASSGAETPRVPGMLTANGQQPSLDMLRQALSSHVDSKHFGNRDKLFHPERLLGSDMEQRYNSLFPRLQQTTVLSTPYRDEHGVINPNAEWHSHHIEQILDLSVLTVIVEKMQQAPAFQAGLERCLGISMRQLLPKERCSHMRKVLHAMLRKLAEVLTGKEIFMFVNEHGDSPFHFLTCEHHNRPTGLSASGMMSDYLPDLITPCRTDPDLCAMARILLRTAPASEQALRLAASFNQSGRSVAPSYFQDLYEQRS